MKRISVNQNTNPTCYLISTPIGNLEDITFRAIKSMQSVDVLLAEDTRVSLKLLRHYQIDKQIVSYHDHNKEDMHLKIRQWFKEGKSIGLISDAGMPLVNDPGYELVLLAIELDVNVVSIPGPSASLSALVISGFTPHPFLFYGFLPNKKQKRIEELARLQVLPETLLFYESPHRIQDTLYECLKAFGDRRAFVARELTKLYEEGISGTLSEIAAIEEWKGEIVLVIEGFKGHTSVASECSIKQDVDRLIESGQKKSDAMKQVAKERNLTKSVVYKEYHEE
jgi:16S rRNA (cytidine1402-2'-O)-methyltransferase